jgi:hypothetical protein
VTKKIIFLTQSYAQLICWYSTAIFWFEPFWSLARKSKRPLYHSLFSDPYRYDSSPQCSFELIDRNQKPFRIPESVLLFYPLFQSTSSQKEWNRNKNIGPNANLLKKAVAMGQSPHWISANRTFRVLSQLSTNQTNLFCHLLFIFFPIKIPVPLRSEFPLRSVADFDRDFGWVTVRIAMVARHFAVKITNGKEWDSLGREPTERNGQPGAKRTKTEKRKRIAAIVNFRIAGLDTASRIDAAFLWWNSWLNGSRNEKTNACRFCAFSSTDHRFQLQFQCAPVRSQCPTFGLSPSPFSDRLANLLRKLFK